MADKLLDSRSDTTVNKYFSYFMKWKTFITSKGGSALPASPVCIALYLTDLMNKGCSNHVISSTVYGIKWAHSLNNLQDPTENHFVKNLVESAKRTLSRHVNKKQPVTKDLLIELCSKYESTTDVLILRDLCMILLGFSAFLRFDEIRNLHCNDITFHDDYFSLHIRKSKTDQYRHGSDVVVAKGDTIACPYSMLRRYFVEANIFSANSHFLFKPCFRTRGISKLIYKDKPLSYTRARETLLHRLREIAGNVDFGLHSLRSGGATDAANASVSDRCWKRHGRWKCDKSKDGYVADSLERRLVTKQLGL
ncbi:integrase/recombinase xerD homolog [Ruditapes philippinarum]|uniref:integrase/recombinase xerD homolog n=1 Tax=Ruditapes philippinarum TaxID=129788 RepID=UPI00295A5E7E|nr:integrase/recombinase xerD homolog [Ruditapes philippinarum]